MGGEAGKRSRNATGIKELIEEEWWSRQSRKHVMLREVTLESREAKVREVQGEFYVFLNVNLGWLDKRINQNF